MQTIARNMRGVVDMSRNDARVLARTAVMDASNKALEQVYSDYSKYITGYRWLATLDGRTCLLCAVHDGEFHADFPNMPPKTKPVVRVRQAPVR